MKDYEQLAGILLHLLLWASMLVLLLRLMRAHRTGIGVGRFERCVPYACLPVCSFFFCAALYYGAHLLL